MLRIKDGVDLKELEKFGFKHKKILYYYNERLRRDYWRMEFEENNEGVNVFVKDCKIYGDEYKKNILYIMDDMCSYIESPVYTIPNEIYDLITSGIVEKVVEEWN